MMHYGNFARPLKQLLELHYIGWYMEQIATCWLKIEHKTFSALKICNFELVELRTNHLMQMNALEELRNETYTSSLIYKDKTNKWHDVRLRGHKDFH